MSVQTALEVALQEAARLELKNTAVNRARLYNVKEKIRVALKEATPPPPSEEGPGGNWTSILVDHFPSLEGYISGSDNTSKPFGEGDSCVFRLGTSEGRSELSINNGSEQQKWREGERYLWEGKLTVPGGYGYGGTGSKHSTIWQFKGLESGAGSPHIALELLNYNNQGNGLYVQDNNYAGTAAYIYKLLPADQIENQEILVQIEVLVSKEKRGRYVIWVDGKKVAEKTSTNTLQPISNYGFIKFGIYAGSAGASRELKVRDQKLSIPAA